MDTATNNPGQAAGASRRVAAHVASLDAAKLPAATVHAFKRALLDYLTCAIAGSRMEPTRIVFDYVSSWDQSREAAVMGTAPDSLPTSGNQNGSSASICRRR